jgi:hypothetical protein
MKMTGGRVTRDEIAKQMSARGKAAQGKEVKAKIPEGKTTSGKAEKFGGKQAPPFGKGKKAVAAEEKGEPKMSKKANAKEEAAEKGK